MILCIHPRRAPEIDVSSRVLFVLRQYPVEIQCMPLVLSVFDIVARIWLSTSRGKASA